MKNKLLIFIITTFCLLGFVSFYYRIPQKLWDIIFKTKTQKIECVYHLEMFDFHYKEEAKEPKIIMLGNSLIRLANWAKLLNRKDVINSGISGDVLPCICSRLKYLKNKNSKIWFIEGGINDLPGRSADSLFEDYKKIIQFVKNENAIPVINLVIYLSPKAGKEFPNRVDFISINKTVEELNKKLVSYATENNIEYLDLNKVVSNNENLLKNEFTTDGVHLNERAYMEWSKLILKTLERNKI